MVIDVLHVTSDTVSNEQGDRLNSLVRHALKNHGKVEVSFKGVINVTSSFINWSFGALRDQYTVSEIKKLVKFLNVSVSVKDMIVLCFSSYEKQEKETISA